jgi:hypothetical protein
MELIGMFLEKRRAPFFLEIFFAKRTLAGLSFGTFVNYERSGRLEPKAHYPA